MAYLGSSEITSLVCLAPLALIFQVMRLPIANSDLALFSFQRPSSATLQRASLCSPGPQALGEPRKRLLDQRRSAPLILGRGRVPRDGCEAPRPYPICAARRLDSGTRFQPQTSSD